jgi:hypothetical protein
VTPQELLTEGIRAAGLDVEQVLDQLAAMKPARRARVVREYQQAGLATRVVKATKGTRKGKRRG